MHLHRLHNKKVKRSLLTLFLSVCLLILYWYHWTPRVIAKFLGLKSRGGSERSTSVSVGFGGSKYKVDRSVNSDAAVTVTSPKSGGMGGGEASLVWVLLGDTHYQPYLLESIRQARVFNPNELFFLVIEPRFWPSNHSWIKPLKKLGVRF